MKGKSFNLIDFFSAIVLDIWLKIMMIFTVMNTIINDWKPETKSLIQTLQKHGLTIVSVNNGESTTNFADTTLGNFINETMACDEARLYVQTPDGKKKWLYLVYGNSPGELVCDYTISPEIDAATDEHYSNWCNREQPTCQFNY